MPETVDELRVQLREAAQERNAKKAGATLEKVRAEREARKREREREKQRRSSAKRNPSLDSVWDGRQARAKSLMRLPGAKKRETAAQRAAVTVIRKDELVWVERDGAQFVHIQKADGQEAFVKGDQLEALFEPLGERGQRPWNGKDRTR